MSILPEIKTGNWYFVVTCPDCGRQGAIGPAPSPSQVQGVYPWPAEVHCDCGNTTLHPPEQIQRLQAQRNAESEPSVVFRLP
jgi:hypothetical protein